MVGVGVCWCVDCVVDDYFGVVGEFDYCSVDFCFVDWLCGDLYCVFEVCDFVEYCYWWFGWCDVVDVGLGCGDWYVGFVGLGVFVVVGVDYFYLDVIVFLGVGDFLL